MASSTSNVRRLGEFDDITSPAKKLLAYLQEISGEIKGDPASLLAATSKYCNEQDTSMIHIGEKKGEILRRIVKELSPKACLELGTYCGYSAVLMADALPDGSRVITVEREEEITELAEQFFTLAGPGVNGKISLVSKESGDAIPTLRKDFSVETFDFVFMDQLKRMYLRDLKLLEAHGLLKTGTVVMADNIIVPGAPDFLEYVQHSGKYKTEVIHSLLGWTDIEDALTKSTYLG